MPISPLLHEAQTIMECPGCLAPRAIPIAILPCQPAKQAIEVYLATSAGGWLRSRWRGRESQSVTSAARLRIRRATAVELSRCCMIT
jgi:hypothetical protein